MKFIYKRKTQLTLLLIALCVLSCKKLTQVPEPVNTITTEETFGSDPTATAAIIGIYSDMDHSNNLAFANGATTIDAGMSADELHSIVGNSPFETSTLNAANTTGAARPLWNAIYFDIYLANAAITNLPGSAGVSAPVKKQLLGEAQFLRAFCYFYLINLYGNVPLVKTNAYTVSDTLHCSPVSAIYQLMIADLQAAQSELATDYSVSNGDRTRVNKYGAEALLARVYLYNNQYAKAIVEADSVISNSGQYSLVSDPNNAFLANSTEAILQLQPNTAPYASQEGNTFVTSNSTSRPNYYLTTQLLSSFEPGDKRRAAWVDSTHYSGKYYYFPYKYKVKTGAVGNVTEYYMLLRLAEQYLIRAEAEAQLGQLASAVADLNILRERAGLPDLIASSLNQTQVMAAVMQERRIELFSEWGHRWFDLKRMGQAHSVLSVLSYKQPWLGDYQLLYPIPTAEITNDPNIVQNPGY